jgi:hypothetical protein
MAKRIRHLGMTLTQEEHDRWHKTSGELTPAQHDKLMKKLGITPEQDAAWHRTHKTPHEQRMEGRKNINPFAVGGAFLNWCVEQGWLAMEGKQYYATAAGARELRQRFGIKI